MTGKGADEHFAGYPYFPAEFLRQSDLSRPKRPLATNHVLREGMQSAVAAEMKTIFRNIGATEHEELPDGDALADVKGSTMPETLLAWHPTTGLFAPWVREQHRGLDFRDTVMASHSPEVQAKMRSRWHPLHTAQYMWNQNSLANELLSCLGDRTEMTHSVEARTPFLDHHLTEYVNRVPQSVKLTYTPVQKTAELEQGPIWKSSGLVLQSLTEKWILREAVRPHINDELYKRKKHPFLAPTRWPTGRALHRLFGGPLTREAVKGLGFLEYAVVEEALGRAFGDKARGRSGRFCMFARG